MYLNIKQLGLGPNTPPPFGDVPVPRVSDVIIIVKIVNLLILF